MNEQSLKDRLKSIAVSENRTFNEVWRKLLRYKESCFRIKPLASSQKNYMIPFLL